MPAKKRRKERWTFQRVVNVGGCQMNCGIKCSPYCRPANPTHWGVIVPEWMIAKRWMPFSTVYGRGANGKHSMSQGCVQAAVPIGVFRNGPKQVSFGRYGRHQSARLQCVERSRLGMASDGWGHEPSAPLGKEKTGPNPTDRAKRGVKRSLLVEGHGIPIGLEVEGANRNDAQDAPGNTPEHSHCSARADRRAKAKPLLG
jgi:hypothetical protein